MKLVQSAVDAFMILLLLDYVQDTGVLAGMSSFMRKAALAAILFPALMTLNALWARAERAWEARRGFKS